MLRQWTPPLLLLDSCPTFELLVLLPLFQESSEKGGLKILLIWKTVRSHGARILLLGSRGVQGSQASPSRSALVSLVDPPCWFLTEPGKHQGG